MANQELVSGSKNFLDQDQFQVLKVGRNKNQVQQFLADAKDDLPMLDYPVGGVFESQNEMGNIGLGSMVKRLVGLR